LRVSVQEVRRRAVASLTSSGGFAHVELLNFVESP